MAAPPESKPQDRTRHTIRATLRKITADSMAISTLPNNLNPNCFFKRLTRPRAPHSVHPRPEQASYRLANRSRAGRSLGDRPGKILLEGELSFKFNEPVANFDIRNAKILIKKLILRQTLTSRCILKPEGQVIDVLVVERNQRMVEDIEGRHPDL
jgi:hypothetical protein